MAAGGPPVRLLGRGVRTTGPGRVRAEAARRSALRLDPGARRGDPARRRARTGRFRRGNGVNDNNEKNKRKGPPFADRSASEGKSPSAGKPTEGDLKEGA